MNKRILIISAIFALPFAASAAGFVNCSLKKDLSDECTYSDLMALVTNVIDYIIYKLATPVAALLIGYAGFKMITSGGDTKTYESAKKMFTNILIGYVVMLTAYLVIKLLFSLLFGDYLGVISPF